MSWRLRTMQSQASSLHRIYERPLSSLELSFYYDSLPIGTSDTTRHNVVQVYGEHGMQTFSPANVSRAWAEVKHYFPLLGARVQMGANNCGSFVVIEDELDRHRPGEINFDTVASLEAVQELLRSIVQGPRRLNSQLLAQIYILKRTDLPDHFHVILHVAHMITDGMSNINLVTRLYEALCSTSPVFDLAERLFLALAADDLDPASHTDLARQRWSRALSYAIREVRWAKLKGGHGLPQIQHPPGHTDPPKSLSNVISFDPELSRRIIANCRTHGLTFGHMYAVIAQVAMTRLLCRLYTSGMMTQEEWDFRKRQPMITGGPLNLRPFLDKSWLRKGGQTTVGCAISFFWYILPFMPLGSAAQLAVGHPVPSYGSLLSKKRFVYRSRLVKKQADNVFKHPMFVSIAKEQSRYRLQRMIAQGSESSLGIGPQAPPFIASFVGSSMGNIEHMDRREFPLLVDNEPVPQKRSPLLRVVESQTILRCRPGELYLGAATVQNRLHLLLYYDGNTYKEELAKEWLREVRDATVFYLGQRKEEVNARL